MRRWPDILFLRILVLILCGWSRSLLGADTITTNQLGQGVVYRHYHYDNLDGGKQEIYVTDINLSDPAVSLALPFLTAGRTVSAHAATVASAAVAVNGQFFDSQGSVQFLKVKGTNIYPSDAAVHDEQALVDDGLRATNSIRINLRSGGINSWTNLAVSNIMACGPELIKSGVKVTNYDTNDPTITVKNPRTCVARTTDNHLLLMCVDSRTANAAGMTIPELRDDVFTRGSIQHAFNLDGGGSTTLWARGIGVANVPSDGSQRAVADAVVISAPLPATPAAPTNLVLASVNTNATLRWALASGAMRYNLKRSTSSTGPFATVMTVFDTSATNSGLAAGTTYYYVVSAVNMIGESTNSTTVNATAIPPPPTNLIAVPGNLRVALSWNAAFGSTGYKVSRSLLSGGPYTQIGLTSSTAFTNTGLVNGTTYYFVVSATNATGTSANSAQVAAIPQCFTPSVPAGLRVITMPGGIALQWQPATNAQNYQVNRATSIGGPYTVLAAGLVATNYTDTNILNNTVYFYTVDALNGCGLSVGSAEASGPLLFVSPIVTSSNIVLRGWGGTPGVTYQILETTNPALPAGEWNALTTNVFGPSGSFAATNPIPADIAQEFYRIQSTQP